MIPPLVAALLPASLAEIQASSALANVLRESLGEAIVRAGGANAATFFQFVNYMRSQGVSGQDFGALYREAKYWTAQGSILNQYPEGVPLDPRLARDLPSSGQYAAEFGGFRTRVTITFTDINNGDTFQRYTWITTAIAPNVEDLFALAAEKAADMLGDSPIPGRTDRIEDYHLSFAVSDFGRIT
jgi:hypothetical protein